MLHSEHGRANAIMTSQHLNPSEMADTRLEITIINHVSGKSLRDAFPP